MDSKLLQGVPLSAAMAAPNVPISSSTGIRAPLTLDDSDFEYSVSTSGKKDGIFSSSSSDSEFQYDGFVSDEDGFETASKRPFVSGSDNGILEETHFVKKYVLNRPIVKIPDEEFIQGISSFRAFDDSRPLFFDSNEEVEDNDNLGEYIDRRPSIAAIDDGTLGASVGEGKNASSVESPVLDTGIARLPKQGMPIAHLSWDSDDDFVGSETFEDEAFSGIVRVPDSEFQERLGDAPKVRGVEVEEVEDSASQTENVSEVEILEDSVLDGDENKVMNSSSEENYVALEEIVLDSISAEVIEDYGPVITEQVEGGDLDERIKEPDPSNPIVEETNNGNMIGVRGAQTVEHILPCEVMEAEVIEVEAIKNCQLASEDIESHRNQNLNAEGTIAGSQSNDNEKLMNEIEQNEVESHDCNASNSIESVDGAMMLDIVPSRNYAELSETNVAQSLECIENIHFSDINGSLLMEDELHGESNISQASHPDCDLEPKTSFKIDNDSVPTEEEEDLLQLDETRSLNFGGSERLNTTEQLEEHISSDSLSYGENSQNHSQLIDEMTGTESKDEPDTSWDLQEEEVSDSSALATPQRASTGVGFEGGNVTFMSADGNRLISLPQLASLGSMVHSLGPTQLNSAILFGPPNLMASGESNEILSEEEKKKLEKIQQIRVKFLRLVHRLKQSPEDSVAANVLYQLLLASGRSCAQQFRFDFAKQAALDLEAEGNNTLDFSLNILVIGKSGVGKSATINSIFGEDKAETNAFQPTTTVLREIKGTLDGVPVRILDTPGLRSSVMEQSTNRKILLSIKKVMKKFSPDIVLYVDRLDLQTRDLNDLPLLKSITSYLGSSIWSQTILTLTHAASTPPEGPSGSALSYELFVAQRSHAVRQLISHSVGNLHILKPSLIPVSLVENHTIWEVNERDHILPPYEERWISKLLLLCYSMKILSEIDSIVRPKDASYRSKFLGLKVRLIPLPYFLTSFLQSSAHPKLSTTRGGENVDSDIELAYLSECDEESEDEYDQLPAFRPLKKSQIAKLDKEQRRAYFEEYDYRVKLLEKKQLKEEVRRARAIKKKHKEGKQNYADVEEDLDQKMESAEALAVPLPDMALPPSFDGDNPAYRYRFLEPSSRILTQPILDSHGWDHDCGFDGLSIEDNLAITGQFPAVITVQLRKDKREFNIHLNSSVSAKHGEKGSTMAGLDIETIGKQLSYTLKTETKIKNFKLNKSAAGISISFLGGKVITGLKVEDQMVVGKKLILVGATGLSRCQNDAAYGANLAIRLKDKDYPIEQDQHLVGLSVMRWRGDNVLGLNLQSQFSVGRNSKLGVRAGLNSKKNGQVSVKISSSDDLHIAMLGLLPIAKTIISYLLHRPVKDSSCGVHKELISKPG